MAASWHLHLLVSDGRGAPSQSHACGSEPLQALSGLVRSLFPPLRPDCRPIWIRLDITASSEIDSGDAEIFRGAFGGYVLQPLGLNPELLVAVLPCPNGSRFWVDRTLPARGRPLPVVSALTEAHACLSRRLDPGGGNPPARVGVLAGLLLLQRVISTPSVELACMGLTRSLLADLQPVSAALSAPRVLHAGGRPHLLASALLLAALAEQQVLISMESARVARHELASWLFETRPCLTQTLQGPVYFALALLAAHGLGPSGWEAGLQSMIRRLADQRVRAEAARCWCLAALLEMYAPNSAHPGARTVELTTGDVLALACLPQHDGNLGIGSALRIVLVSRLLLLMGSDCAYHPSTHLLSAAGRFLLDRQCAPQRAMEVHAPQSLLGAFVSPACRSFSPWAQLPPLLALTELHRLQAVVDPTSVSCTENVVV